MFGYVYLYLTIEVDVKPNMNGLLIECSSNSI